MYIDNWKKLTTVNLDALGDARKQSHQAVQIPAAVGISYLVPRSDYSHGSLSWLENLGVFAIDELQSSENYRFIIRLENLTLSILENSGKIVSEYILDNRTQDEALLWVKEQLSKLGFDAGKFTTSMKYSIPSYPQIEGEPFIIKNKIAFYEFPKYFANAGLVLKTVAEKQKNMSKILCWPHHFDLAATINNIDKSDKSKMIGLGFSPGDENYAEPYFYIYPWPYPDIKSVQLPELSEGGKWHKENWVGAILTSTQIVSESSARGQAEKALNFVNNAVKASFDLLG